MLRDRKIAVFVDVDNALLEYQHYDNVMQQLRSMGEIVCGTVYGASERKHKKVIIDAQNNGFAIQLPSRTRRRVRKVFDDRIFVDVADLVLRNSNVDTVAIVSHPTDLVYLFSYLRRAGIQVISTEDLDEQSLALVSQTLDLGKVETIKLPKKSAAPKKPVAPKPLPKVEEPKKEEAKPAPKVEERKPAEKASRAEADRTEELLREIAKLQQSYEAPVREKPAPQTVVEPTPVAEEKPKTKPVEEAQPDIVNETQSLMEKIASLQEESVTEQPGTVEQPKQQPKTVEPPKPVEEPAIAEPQPIVEEGPRATYVSQNDSDLIRRIEELRKNNAGNDSDDLIAEIKKLLDGLE